MVRIYGIRSPHYPTNVISLARKTSEIRFLSAALVASLHKVAFADCKRGRVVSAFVKVKQPRISDNRIISICTRVDWSIKSSADGRGLDPFNNSSDGRTRLIKTIQSLQIRLNARIRDIRKDLPRKFLFFLLGFYCATAFATVIGQTGDWDILSAALAVAVVEVIGALMYKASVPFLDRFKNIIAMFNYWKAGLTLGLFLDSFKY